MPFIPFIKATFEPRGPMHVVLLVQNIGNAPAIDVHLEVWLEPSDFKRKVLFPLLMPNQKIRFLLPEGGNLKTLAEKYTTLRIKSEYRDIFGEKKSVNDIINVKEVLQSWAESRILIEETVENRLSQVAQTIERTRDTIRMMLARTGGILVKTPKDIEKEYEKLRRRFEKLTQAEKKQEPTDSG